MSNTRFGSKIFGRVTGGDKGLKTPVQQISGLGRPGDLILIYPYGMYCDLPDKVMTKELAEGWVVPVTQTRPSDTARGETTYFHPVTNTRIIARNNGDLDIITNGKETNGNVNIFCVDANVVADNDVTVTAGNDITGTASGDIDLIASGHADISCETSTIGAATSVTLDTPTTTCTGDLIVGGTLGVTGASTLAAVGMASAAVTGTLTQDGTDVGKAHAHSQPDTGPNDTVQGNTGAVI